MSVVIRRRNFEKCVFTPIWVDYTFPLYFVQGGGTRSTIMILPLPLFCSGVKSMRLASWPRFRDILTISYQRRFLSFTHNWTQKVLSFAAESKKFLLAINNSNDYCLLSTNFQKHLQTYKKCRSRKVQFLWCLRNMQWSIRDTEIKVYIIQTPVWRVYQTLKYWNLNENVPSIAKGYINYHISHEFHINYLWCDMNMTII
jgi:hypothetical protein